MLAFGYVSGGHFNPAITLGHLVAGRIRHGRTRPPTSARSWSALRRARWRLFGILRTVPNIPDARTAFDTVTAGFGEHSVIQTPMAGVLLLEVLGAALLVAVFLGMTARRNIHAAAAPFAVGPGLCRAAAAGPGPWQRALQPGPGHRLCLFSTSWSLEQLWLFWVAPLVGAGHRRACFPGFRRRGALQAPPRQR